MLIKEYLQDHFIKETKEDMHIHPRPDCFSVNVLCKYIDLSLTLGIHNIGFVEHGKRISKNHQGILTTEDDIIRFAKAVETVGRNYASKNISIRCGIEIDYSDEASFVQNVIQMCNKTEKLDYIIGSVHGFSKKTYKEYLDATTNLIEKYDIDILGHFILSQDISKYNYEIDNIFNILRDKNISLELNKAARYDCSDKEIKSYICEKIIMNGINFSFGSDAHSYLELITNNKRKWFS